MLEFPSLWLGPWQLTGDGLSRERAIHDPATGFRVGVARWRPIPQNFWGRWLSRATLEILETDDESLVFTLHRGFCFRETYEVRDAEGRFISTTRGNAARDPYGRPLARIVAPLDGTLGSLITPDGLELLTFEPANQGLRLTFSPALEDNPFAKMGLLGALLQKDALE